MSCVRGCRPIQWRGRCVVASNKMPCGFERDAMQTRTDASFPLLRTLLRRALESAQACRRWIGPPYRPEKHYMRGPGPKWREKHGDKRPAF